MSTLTPSGLKIPDNYGNADWEVYDAFNWARLNDVLLKLSALLDVDISGRADGDVLAWDAAAGKWKPKPPPASTTTTTTTTTSTTTTTI